MFQFSALSLWNRSVCLVFHIYVCGEWWKYKHNVAVLSLSNKMGHGFFSNQFYTRICYITYKILHIFGGLWTVRFIHAVTLALSSMKY